MNRRRHEVKVIILIVGDGKVVCPYLRRPKEVKKCFGCRRFLMVSHKNGRGELKCKMASEIKPLKRGEVRETLL